MQTGYLSPNQETQGCAPEVVTLLSRESFDRVDMSDFLSANDTKKKKKKKKKTPGLLSATGER